MHAAQPPSTKSEWLRLMITSSSSNNLTNCKEEDVDTSNGRRSSKSRREHNVKHVYGYEYIMNTVVMPLKRPENEDYACAKALAEDYSRSKDTMN